MFSRLKLITRTSKLLAGTFAPPTIRSLQPVSVSPLLVSPLQHLLLPSSRCLSSTSTPAKHSTVVQRIPIPPNLHIDPRSSFITHENSVEEEVDEEADEEEEEDSGIAQTVTDALEQELTYAIPLPDRLHVNVFDIQDNTKEIGTIWLDSNVFGRDPIRVDLLKRAVDYIRAKKRGRRKAVTKTISQVSGSGKKMRPQKGTGKARVGHKRPPHFRGGAKAHGPKNVTDYGNTKLNKKVRKQALCHALSQKLKEGNLILVNSLEISSHKTKDLSRVLSLWEIGGREGESALILDHYYPRRNKEETDDSSSNKDTANADGSSTSSFRGVPANLHVASRNIPRIQVGNTNAANVYDLLRSAKLVLTLEAMTVLERRLKNF